MDTAVGKIAVHTVNLRQVLGTADRADIHVEFLVAAVIAVSQGQVDALVVAKLYRTLDQCLDRAFVVADRIAHVLDFSAVAELPETSLEILFLDRGDVLGYVAVETVAHIRAVRNVADDTVLFAELLYLQAAQGFCWTNPDGSAILNFTEVASASWVGLPPFQLCKFNLTAILVMAPIALATMMEHIGDMSAISATVGENFIEDPGLHRTLIGDGLATAFAGMVGGPANTTYGENTGVLELSRVHDPRVIRIAAVFAVILSFIPKMAEIIGSMPSAIIGGVSFMLYGMISAIGVRNVVENHVDFTKSRNLIIAAVILVSGLGFSKGLTFTIAGTSITLTGLAIAALAGIILNAILPGKDYHFGDDPKADANRGLDMNPIQEEDIQ